MHAADGHVDGDVPVVVVAERIYTLYSLHLLE
jgi:hypothetical protein